MWFLFFLHLFAAKLELSSNLDLVWQTDLNWKPITKNTQEGIFFSNENSAPDIRGHFQASQRDPSFENFKETWKAESLAMNEVGNIRIPTECKIIHNKNWQCFRKGGNKKIGYTFESRTWISKTGKFDLGVLSKKDLQDAEHIYGQIKFDWKK